MRLTCFPSVFSGSFTPPVSKSDAIRAIICALLSDKRTVFPPLPSSDDVVAAIECAESLGARYDGKIFAPPEKFPSEATLNCRESAACLRFFACVTAAIGGNFTLKTGESLSSRPTETLAETLKSGGVTLERTQNGFKTKGKLKAGKYTVDGDVSSQFLSGMLLAAPYISGETEITGKNLVSGAYVKRTLSVMRAFSAEIKEKKRADGTVYLIPNASFTPPERLTLGEDWSGASFMLAAGALGGEVTALGMPENAPDGQIVDILDLFGCDVRKSKNPDGTVDVTAKKRAFKPFEYDYVDCPDLVPVCCVLAANANGKSALKNVARLKTKESDRVTSCIRLIESLGAKAEFDGKDILVRGGKTTGGAVKTYGDHRIAMAAACAAAGSTGTVEIDDAECVKKSYASFWNDYVSTGGAVKCNNERERG
ncbi:MAG: 3-phosphoshikimate 1-carboxyvinyltransferase [Candidatus Neoclostridium sp.]